MQRNLTPLHLTGDSNDTDSILHRARSESSPTRSLSGMSRGHLNSLKRNSEQGPLSPMAMDDDMARPGGILRVQTSPLRRYSSSDGKKSKAQTSPLKASTPSSKQSSFSTSAPVELNHCMTPYDDSFLSFAKSLDLGAFVENKEGAHESFDEDDTLDTSLNDGLYGDEDDGNGHVTSMEYNYDGKRTSHENLSYSEVEIITKIGSGQFGQVFVAIWDDNTVAMKRLIIQPPSSNAHDDTETDLSSSSKNHSMEKLLAELHVHDQLPPHLNVCPLIGFFVHNEMELGLTLNLLMPYYALGNVQNLLVWIRTCVIEEKHDELVLSEEEVQWLCTSIALDTIVGIEQMHKCGVIHRDIASRNLLLSQHGHVVVSDFGLSRHLLDNTHHSMTMGGMFPVCVPPEVVSDERYRKESDVYSFGVLLWEIYTLGDILLNPTQNVKSNNMLELIRVISTGQFVNLFDFAKAPQVPTAVTALIKDCLSMKIMDRPTCLQLIGRLQTVRKGLEKKHPHLADDFMKNIVTVYAEYVDR